MTIQELIEKLNKYCEEHSIYSAGVLYAYNVLQEYNFEYIDTVDRDEHRWYILGESVYAVIIDGKKYYIGTWEVESLKSEMMDLSDCGCVLEFYEMEEYTTVSYRMKK